MIKTPKVFICHASEDKDRFVLGFASRLRARGVDAWIDIWEMLPGDKLVTRVFEEGLKPSDAVIVVLSNYSIVKPWVRKELDTAVVKSLEDQTRLIPVRLDNCEVPECLRDTIWQEVRDVDSYDPEFERIVNALFGQYEKPPLGDQPSYVRGEVLRMEGLTRIDSVVFEQACKIAMGQGYADHVSAGRLESELAELGVSTAQIVESQEILEGRGYIRLLRVIGPPHVYHLGITTYGFDQFVHATISDYGKITAEVAGCLVKSERMSNGSLAKVLNQPTIIIEHILIVLEQKGFIKVAKSIGGGLHMDVYWVSPELRRMLEAGR